MKVRFESLALLGVLLVSMAGFWASSGAAAQTPEAAARGPAPTSGAPGPSQTADAGTTLSGRLFMQRGQYALAIQALRPGIQSTPDDPELHALMGISQARMTFFADAVVSLDFAPGSSAYESEGVNTHADSLRVVGQSARAAELHGAGLLASELSKQDEMLLWVDLVDDHLYAGDLEAAHAAAVQCLTLRPRSGGAHAVMADVALASGDLESTGFHLWMAAEDGQQILRAMWVEWRLALVLGDLATARAVADEALLFRRRHPRVQAMQAETLRQEGDPESAMGVLDRPDNKLKEHPEILAARISTLQDLGRTVEATSLAAWAGSVYPSVPAVQAAAAAVRED